MQVSGIICRRTFGQCLLLLSVTCLVSCSGGKPVLNVVKGSVTYKGQPAGGILVTFHPSTGDDPKKQVPTGHTNDDGTFEVSTGQDDGAPEGTYNVTMIWMVEAAGTKKKAPGTMSMVSEVPMEDKLKKKYSDAKHPMFKDVIIKKGANTLDTFNLQ